MANATGAMEKERRSTSVRPPRSFFILLGLLGVGALSQLLLHRALVLNLCMCQADGQHPTAQAAGVQLQEPYRGMGPEMHPGYLSH